MTTESDSHITSYRDCFKVKERTVFTGPGTLNITAGMGNAASTEDIGIFASGETSTVSIDGATINITADVGYWGSYYEEFGTCSYLHISNSNVNINATNKAFSAAK